MFDLEPRTTGRAQRSFDYEIVRELEQEDFAALQVEKGVKNPPLVRLRERHHALARSLASGMSSSDAAILNGYDPTRVSILTGDPAFKELVEHYRAGVTEQWAGIHEQLVGLTRESIAEIRERLEEAPESISTKDLIRILASGADRSGHGPATTQTQVNVNVNLASRLEQARKRVIDLEPNQ